MVFLPIVLEMKNLHAVFFIVVIFACPIFTLGQKNNTSWIKADFGANNTWILNQNMYGNPELPYTVTIGYAGELSYQHFFNEYGYSVGLGIADLGQNYEGEMAGANAQRKVNLTYLELPVMGLYNLGGKRQQIWLSAGPQLMFLLSAKQNFSRTGERVIPDPELLSQGTVDVSNRFKPVDIMLAFRVTNFFPIKLHNVIPYRPSENFMWSLSLDGAFGLSDINQKQYQISNIHNVYSGSHNFYLGIRIGIMSNLKSMHKSISNMFYKSEF